MASERLADFKAPGPPPACLHRVLLSRTCSLPASAHPPPQLPGPRPASGSLPPSQPQRLARAARPPAPLRRRPSPLRSIRAAVPASCPHVLLLSPASPTLHMRPLLLPEPHSQGAHRRHPQTPPRPSTAGHFLQEAFWVWPMCHLHRPLSSSLTMKPTLHPSPLVWGRGPVWSFVQSGAKSSF